MFDFSPPEDGSKPFTKPIGRVRTVQVILPRGIIGNPESTPKCSGDDFLDAGRAGFEAAGCPADTQIGTLNVLLADQWVGAVGAWFTASRKSRSTTSSRRKASRLTSATRPALSSSATSTRPSTPPATTQSSRQRPTSQTSSRSRNVRRGSGACPATRPMIRSAPSPQVEGPDGKPLPGPEFGAHVEGPYRPLLNMPMDCGVDNGPFLFSTDSWNNPEEFTPQLPAVSGDVNVTAATTCGSGSTRRSTCSRPIAPPGGPTGLDVHLEVEQRDQSVQNPELLYPENEQLHGIDTPPMKKVVTTFPEGMTISTSAAQGLGVCSSAQLALGDQQTGDLPR